MIESYKLWASGFRVSACKGTVTTDTTPSAVKDALRMLRPTGTRLFYQQFVRDSSPTSLTLPFVGPDDTAPKDEVVLGSSGFRYRITHLQQYPRTWPEQPFLVHELKRAFIVTHKTEPVGRPAVWAKADAVSIDARFDAARGWLTGAPSALSVRDPVDSSSSVSTPKPAPSRAAGAPARTLAALSRLYPIDAAPSLATTPVTARAVVEYSVEGAGTTSVAAGSDSLRALTIKDVLRVPSVTVTSPAGKLMPMKRTEVDRYLFSPFHHPYVCTLINQLHRYGLDGLLDPSPSGTWPTLRRQQLGESYFQSEYAPGRAVAKPYPRNDFDFSYGGAYSIYNWELFFHIPIHIALRLVADQRFEESLRWFHAVFHPMERAVPSEALPGRVWKIKPFFEAGLPASIDDLLGTLSYGGDDEDRIEQKKQVERQIAEMRAHPFEPHRIARLRTPAYQRFVVMKYVEMLIAWGDQLFGRETLESLNEALQLYVLALRILGKRPERIEKSPSSPPATPSFRSLVEGTTLDAFSNAIVGVEALLTETAVEASTPATADAVALGGTFLFCIPPNEKLLGLWDLVEDRLFKIRHCMNIEGVVRQLPLFEPPIDPALLVRARALGLDLASVLGDVNAPPPVRRFRVLVGKAQEMCGELKALSASLLAALEKRDAEELARIRARQERDILELGRITRERQIEEAGETLAGLKLNLSSAQKRRDHYTALLAQGQLPQEDLQQERLDKSSEMQRIAQGLHLEASVLAAIPQTGVVGPAPTSHFGGQHLHAIYSGLGNAFGSEAGIASSEAASYGNRAIVLRRASDWQLQAELAAKDVEQIERQIAAQEIRVAIAEHELRMHDRQVANAKETEEFLRDKFTKKELYDWMVSQLSALYFQFYKLTFDLAKRAERAFQFERAEPSRAFVKFGAWESLRKGLLSGERLSLDLRRMEAAFLTEDRRDFELTRHVRLSEIDPSKLVELREKGSCELTIPEILYDADTPGHYLRRIRSVSLTIPTTTGPYVPVRCAVTLKSSQIRRAADTASTALVRSDVPVQTVVTSHARDDAGVFELDARDERYLPFEGAGAIATFALELPDKLRAFDYETIQDVVLHVRYTARDGGSNFRSDVKSATENTLKTSDTTPLTYVVSIKNELPDAWYRLLQAPAAAPNDFITVDVPLTRDRFPFIDTKDIQLLTATVVGIVADPAKYPGSPATNLSVTVTPPNEVIALEKLSTEYGGQPRKTTSGSLGALGTAITATLKVTGISSLSSPLATGSPKHLNGDFLHDILLVVKFAAVNPPPP